VGIDEAGEESFALEIDAFGVWGDGLRYFRKVADGDDFVSANRDCIGVGVLGVGGEDLGVEENSFTGSFLGLKRGS